LAVGRVLRPHGLNGEVRVEILTDYPERFSLHETLYLGSIQEAEGEGCTPYGLESYRFHKGAVLLKLEGIDERNAAETLRELLVWIPFAQAVPLEEGEQYEYQMVGLTVVTDEGQELGQVAEIIDTGAAAVYVVRGMRGEILLPDTSEVVLDVDVEAGRMVVHLIEGLV
jgi:16S rRNA processing protein RimM